MNYELGEVPKVNGVYAQSSDRRSSTNSCGSSTKSAKRVRTEGNRACLSQRLCALIPVFFLGLPLLALRQEFVPLPYKLRSHILHAEKSKPHLEDKFGALTAAVLPVRTATEQGGVDAHLRTSGSLSIRLKPAA